MGGNIRFVEGKSQHPHTDSARLIQAGKENQANHAYATVITCSDSRVPVERIFDAGIMDTFVIRVAGNVIDTDEAGSIEYGLAHVNTPVLVVLGHTQCGAILATLEHCPDRGCLMSFAGNIERVDTRGDRFCDPCAGRMPKWLRGHARLVEEI